jgi:hypothetical protein
MEFSDRRAVFPAERSHCSTSANDVEMMLMGFSKREAFPFPKGKLPILVNAVKFRRTAGGSYVLPHAFSTSILIDCFRDTMVRTVSVPVTTTIRRPCDRGRILRFSLSFSRAFHSSAFLRVLV